jgi:hypothetical protein
VAVGVDVAVAVGVEVGLAVELGFGERDGRSRQLRILPQEPNFKPLNCNGTATSIN